MWCAKPLRMFYRFFQWPIAGLNGMANGVLRRVGIQHASGHDASHSNEELRMLVSASAAGGHLDETERVLLDNVFDFSERVAREIMVPRNEMACLYTDDPIADSLTTALEAGHSRLPVCEGEKDNILGVIHMRDLFRHHGELKDLREIMRPIMVVPETVSISRLLKQFQRQKNRMAILVDEYGGTAGLITLEDLLEEIVGDIQDEFDEEEPAEIQNVGPHIFDVDGAMLLEEAQEQLGLRFEELEGVDTLGGYVLSALGNKPEVGQEVILGQHLFGVAEVEGFRITRVLIKPRPSDDPSDADAASA
jgi:CBS domain containing-hemolysin-like protein